MLQTRILSFIGRNWSSVIARIIVVVDIIIVLIVLIITILILLVIFVIQIDKFWRSIIIFNACILLYGFNYEDFIDGPARNSVLSETFDDSSNEKRHVAARN